MTNWKRILTVGAIGAAIVGCPVDENVKKVENAKGNNAQVSRPNRSEAAEAGAEEAATPAGKLQPEPEGDTNRAKADKSVKKRPLVQIAILLDTSNSMDGLIDQAKARLWEIVNEFAGVTRGGVRPDLRVALFEYGNDRIPAGENHVRQILPFTDDLDRISEELFALQTCGGQEYCGTVVRDAVKNLNWSAAADDYKAIFIAGNEPFTQGSVDYRDACRAAIAKGVMVNTIFCGGYKEGVQTMWQDGATIADGSYANIDHNRREVQVSAPQDAEIVKLNVMLNATYVAFGAQGKIGAARQVAQDNNAKNISSGTLGSRGRTKSSTYYRNWWDIVDNVRDGKVRLEEIKKEDLPEEMQELTLDEKKEFIARKQAERREIQEKIRVLYEARQKHVAAELKKSSKNDAESLDSAMIKTLRKQAEKKGFEFGK